MKPNLSFDPQQALAIMQSTILADEFNSSCEHNEHAVTVQGVGRGEVKQQEGKVVVSTSSALVEIKELG